MRKNNNANDSISSSNNNISDYDNEKWTQKIVPLKLKPFFQCNVIGR